MQSAPGVQVATAGFSPEGGLRRENVRNPLTHRSLQLT